MLATAITVVLSYSQLLTFGGLLAFALFLGFRLGINEGRMREAAEPCQHLVDDDGGGLGAVCRGRH